MANEEGVGQLIFDTVDTEVTKPKSKRLRIESNQPLKNTEKEGQQAKDQSRLQISHDLLVCIGNTKDFAAIIRNIAFMVTDVVLRFTSSEMAICAVDESKVAYFTWKVANSSCDTYVCNQPRHYGIDVKALSDVISGAHRYDQITFFIPNSNMSNHNTNPQLSKMFTTNKIGDDQFILFMLNKEDGSFHRSVITAKACIDDVPYVDFDVDFEAKLKLSSNSFFQSIQSMFKQKIPIATYSTDTNELWLSGSNHLLQTQIKVPVNGTIHQPASDLYDGTDYPSFLSDSKFFHKHFMLKFVVGFARFHGLCKDVYLKFSRTGPLSISYAQDGLCNLILYLDHLDEQSDT